MERERRAVGTSIEVRAAEGEAPSLSGYAAMFNSETVIAGYFRETIAPGAFRDAIKTDDVRALFNHDPNYVLGRTTNDTLKLTEDKQGLHYDVTLNMADPDAVRVRAKVERGDVTGSSFGFFVEEEKWQEPAKGSRELPLRTILKASLFDVSPVTYPAYDSTSVSARSRSHAESLVDAAKTLAAAEQAAKPEAVKDREALRAQLDAAKTWPRSA